MRIISITLTSSDGDVEIERETGMDPATEFRALPLQELPPGSYRFDWRGMASTATRCRVASPSRSLSDRTRTFRHSCRFGHCAKAVGYGAALLATGGVLFGFIFAKRPEASVLRLARQLAVGAALVGLAVLAIRFGIRAARISGMGFEGATDPTMLGYVWESPLGTAAIWRVIGKLAILAILVPRIGQWIALAGSLAVAISFTQIGHALGEPRIALAVLLVLHVLAAALWVGALVPLRRAALAPTGADLLHHFGNVAAFGVAILIIAGTMLAWLLSGSVAELFGTAYGLGLLLKVAIVAALLGFAGFNKVRLVPALRAEKSGSITALRRSISMEVLAVVMILLATATITSVTTPPRKSLTT